MSWLPKPETLKPEYLRRAEMDRYADLQVFKLKVVIALIILNILVRL